MKKLPVYLCLALMSFSSVAYAAKKEEKKPTWLNNPYAACAQEEMCAVGVGEGMNRAKADARSGIAKIFEARIKSSFEQTITQDGDDTSSKIRDFVAEDSDVIIQAVEIKETYKTTTEVYALAVLNKRVAAKITREDIGDLDQKMEALLTEDTPAAAVRLEKLYEQRRGLNQRYIVLTGSSIMESVTYDQVYKNKKARIGKKHIYLTVQGKANKAFDQTVRNVMKDNGYTFAASETNETPRVIISWEADEQYSNINGFVKYDYHFTMKAPDKKGKIIDVLATTVSESGRNEKQAQKNALDTLKVYLDENMINLNF